jgi:hypothetical protein
MSIIRGFMCLIRKIRCLVGKMIRLVVKRMGQQRFQQGGKRDFFSLKRLRSSWVRVSGGSPRGRWLIPLLLSHPNADAVLQRRTNALEVAVTKI